MLNWIVWNHHHHHDVRLPWISLTLSLHVFLSIIAFGRSSGLHPVSSHSCCMNVRAGCPAFDWPYAGVHRSTSLTISSLLLQQCPACLVHLTCIVFEIGGRWPYCDRTVGTVQLAPLLPGPVQCQRPSSASIQLYRHDRRLEETAFHFIGQVWFPYDRKPIDSCPCLR